MSYIQKPNTCPKCGSAAVPEAPRKYPSTRIHFACDGYGYTDGGEFDLVYRSELCFEREEKNTLQRKVEELEAKLDDKHKEVCELKRERNRLIDELQASKRETLYVFNNASCKTVAHFAVDENGKHPIDLSVEPITKDKPDWAVKEGYWYEQYQLMRERYHKQIGENSKQAERIRELEEQLQAKLDDLKASTIHSCGDSCSRPMCVLRRERDAYKEALQMCVFWAESISRRVTEDRDSINWTGLQIARKALADIQKEPK